VTQYGHIIVTAIHDSAEYIKFLIGGGSYRAEADMAAKTRVDLLVNGR